MHRLAIFALVCCTAQPEQQTFTSAVTVTSEVAVDSPVTSPRALGTQLTVASAGSRHVVVWGASDGLRAMRVEDDGTVLDPGGIVVGQGTNPMASFDGTEFVIAWSAPGP